MSAKALWAQSRGVQKVFTEKVTAGAEHSRMRQRGRAQAERTSVSVEKGALQLWSPKASVAGRQGSAESEEQEGSNPADHVKQLSLTGDRKPRRVLNKKVMIWVFRKFRYKITYVIGTHSLVKLFWSVSLGLDPILNSTKKVIHSNGWFDCLV